MSISDSTVKGKFDEVSGKVKQTVGEATGNDNLANRGTAQQVKGHAEQAWGSVKEAAHDTGERSRENYDERRGPQSETTAHDIRESVASTARNAKENIQEAVGKKKSA